MSNDVAQKPEVKAELDKLSQNFEALAEGKDRGLLFACVAAAMYSDALKVLDSIPVEKGMAPSGFATGLRLQCGAGLMVQVSIMSAEEMKALEPECEAANKMPV